LLGNQLFKLYFGIAGFGHPNGIPRFPGDIGDAGFRNAAAFNGGYHFPVVPGVGDSYTSTKRHGGVGDGKPVQ
jgi:hypothetical protein